MLASRASEVMTEYMQGGPASCSVAAGGVVAAAAGGLVCQGDTRKATWGGRLWSLILGICSRGLRKKREKKCDLDQFSEKGRVLQGDI